MFVVVYDACVLYPAPMRDFLMHLATTGLFSARWTNQIHDEWIRNLQRKRPDLDVRSLKRTRELMDEAVEDCLVTGYESLIEGLTLPDPDDRHVVAAATWDVEESAQGSARVFGNSRGSRSSCNGRSAERIRGSHLA